MFWDCVARGELRPGLRMRELDGETIAFRQTAAPEAALVAFARTAFTRTWELVPRWLVLLNVARRMVRARCISPFRWGLAILCSWRVMAKSSDYSTAAGRNYLGGQECLDAVYGEQPADITAEDRARYFDPVLLTKADGGLADWLVPYQPREGAAAGEPSREAPVALPSLS